MRQSREGLYIRSCTQPSSSNAEDSRRPGRTDETSRSCHWDRSSSEGIQSANRSLTYPGAKTLVTLVLCAACPRSSVTRLGQHCADVVWCSRKLAPFPISSFCRFVIYSIDPSRISWSSVIRNKILGLLPLGVAAPLAAEAAAARSVRAERREGMLFGYKTGSHAERWLQCPCSRERALLYHREETAAMARYPPTLPRTDVGSPCRSCEGTGIIVQLGRPNMSILQVHCHCNAEG